MKKKEQPEKQHAWIIRKILSLPILLKTSDHAFLIVIPIFIGLVGGLGAGALRTLIHFFQELFWGNQVNQGSMLRTLLVPAAGAFLVGLIIYYFSREAKGHGVPEVMEAISVKSGVIRPRVVVAKVVASAITIASGGSVGREGPIVQIGSAMGSTIGQVLRLSKERMRTLVACGAAAGIAAAFNAPIAGAMFSVEIILGDFAVHQFSPIVIASVSATVISRMFYGNFPAFTVPKYDLVHPFELIPYAVLGIICGMVALLFIKTLYYLEDRFDAYKVPDYYKTTMGGLIIGIYGLSFPQIFGVGYGSMEQALHGKMGIGLLLALIFMKIFASSMTLGSGSSGGIFAPSLFIGAMTGGFFGNIVHRLFPTLTAGPGAYSLVAMSAVVGAATHAPITAILIIFEMTSDYKIILPLMIATIISLTTVRLQRGSIYTLKLIRKGIKFNQGRDLNVLQKMKVKEIMRKEIETIRPDTPLEKIIDLFLKSDHATLFIRNENGKITERIQKKQLSLVADSFEDIKDLVLAYDLAVPHHNFITEEDNLDSAMREFGREDVDELPVVSSNNPDKLLGSLWRIDVINSYNNEIMKHEMAGEVSKLMSLSPHRRMVEVTDGLFLMEIDVPGSFIGKKIDQLDVRNRYGVDVVLIKKHDERKRLITRIPDHAYTFLPHDRLLVMGKKKKVDYLSKL